METASVLSPLAGLIINFAAQAAAFRLRTVPLLKSVYLGFAAGAAATIAIDLAAPAAGTPDILISGLATYALLGYCYFHFVNLGETARRIRIIAELSAAPEGLSESEILARYNAKEIIAARIKRLESNRQIELAGGRYKIAGTAVLAMATAISFLKILLLGKNRSDFR